MTSLLEQNLDWMNDHINKEDYNEKKESPNAKGRVVVLIRRKQD